MSSPDSSPEYNFFKKKAVVTCEFNKLRNIQTNEIKIIKISEKTKNALYNFLEIWYEYDLSKH